MKSLVLRTCILGYKHHYGLRPSGSVLRINYVLRRYMVNVICDNRMCAKNAFYCLFGNEENTRMVEVMLI